MKTWQEQDPFSSVVGGRALEGGLRTFSLLSLSEWDPQMFYYAEASYLRVLYCSLSGCPG